MFPQLFLSFSFPCSSRTLPTRGCDVGRMHLRKFLERLVEFRVQEVALVIFLALKAVGGSLGDGF
jgi:hypothetical protein